jgi:stage V sporulation protein R
MSNFKFPEQSEWTFDLIAAADRECGRVAAEFKLDTYPNQLEIITSEQMMDAYSSVGMPTGYNHWSFGKSYISTEQSYKKGNSGLAYEIVINSNPCIAYLMEENSLTMQALVIAHACYGHNSFFKSNYLFRQWTDAEGIIDYLVFAKNYIAQCESKYGAEEVELVLDACHALQNHGVDRYQRPAKRSLVAEMARQKERADYAQSQVNDVWSKTAPDFNRKDATEAKNKRFPAEPEENILYFIEKHSPTLEPWKREIVRIVRKIAQYFYPQRQTQVMNEGHATFWHYTILNKLYDEDVVGDGFMMEFLQSHSGVVYQHPKSRINPYALGFAMMKDIRRMCENPTEEDKAFLPDIAGGDWVETLDFAIRNYKDESFIQQYLSPKIIRDFHLFTVRDDDNNMKLEIADIHDIDGYKNLRQTMSEQYNLSAREPNIQVWNTDLRNDRSLTLRYTQVKRRSLNDGTAKVLKYAKYLWGFDVHMETVTADGVCTSVQTAH